MSEKRCTRCGKMKPLTEFSIDRSKKDGRNARCRACKAEVSREYYRRHAEEQREKSRRYRRIHSEERKEYSRRYYRLHAPAIRAKNRKYKQRNRVKVQAHNAVTLAIKKGRLQPAYSQLCVDCLAEGTLRQAEELHHESYKPEHWLDVIPLCKKHHRRRHAQTRSRQEGGAAAPFEGVRNENQLA